MWRKQNRCSKMLSLGLFWNYFYFTIHLTTHELGIKTTLSQSKASPKPSLKLPAYNPDILCHSTWTGICPCLFFFLNRKGALGPPKTTPGAHISVPSPLFSFAPHPLSPRPMSPPYHLSSQPSPCWTSAMPVCLAVVPPLVHPRVGTIHPAHAFRGVTTPGKCLVKCPC